MGAAALTLREGLEAVLVIMAMLPLVRRAGRWRLGSLIAGVGAAILLGVGIGAAAALIADGLDARGKASWQAAMMMLGAALMVWVVLVKPADARLRWRLQTAREPGGLRLTALAFRAIAPTAIVTAVLLYDFAAGAWGAADLGGGLLGTATGGVLGLAGAALIVAVNRRQVRRRTLLAAIGLLLIVVVGYELANDLHALPKAGLIPVHLVTADPGGSAIATLLALAAAALIVRLEQRRGPLGPVSVVALTGPVFIALAGYEVLQAGQTLKLAGTISDPELLNFLVLPIIIGVVVFMYGRRFGMLSRARPSG